MKNYFTIQKVKAVVPSQTKTDYENFLVTSQKEKSLNDSTKSERINKENIELFSLPDMTEVQEDVRQYLATDKDAYDPFTKTKAIVLNSVLNPNLKQNLNNKELK